MSEPLWISEQEAVAINAQVIARFGGVSGGVRDETLLTAALARPLNKWHYDDPRPDLFALAAAYAFAIARGHVFLDGNKRAAYVVAVTFLALNGVTCAPDGADIVNTLTALAAGELTEEAFAAWLGDNAVDPQAPRG